MARTRFCWLGAIAENLILNASKQVGRHQCLRLDRSLPGAGTAGSQALRRKERVERLRDGVEGLSEEPRTVILLTRIEGPSIKETAARMRRSESAVENLLLRALKNLRRSFGHTESLNLPGRRLEPKERAMSNDAKGDRVPLADGSNGESAVETIVAAYVDRLNLGEELSSAEILALHSELGPEILDHLEVFLEAASGSCDNDPSEPPATTS